MGFRIPWAVFRIPTPKIQIRQAKISPIMEFGFAYSIAKRYQHGSSNLLWTSTWNRTLSSSKNPHFQNEARFTTFLVKMSFICMRMKNDFHIKDWAPTLVLKQRPGGTRKWPIAVQNWVHPIWCYFPFYVGWQCKSICGGKVDAFWLFRRSCLGWRRKGTFYVTQCI